MEVKKKSKRSYGGVSSEARDVMRREALVAAGIELFGAAGYAATTIEALCSEASVSTRDFYSYFKTKEDLMLAVYDRVIAQTMESVGARVAQAFERDDDLPGVIRAGVGAFAEAMVEDERWGRINFIEVVGVSPRVESRRREVIGDFGRIVAAISEALAERDGIDMAAFSSVHSVALVGAVHETLTDWVTGGDRPPLDQTVDALVEIFAAVMRR